MKQRCMVQSKTDIKIAYKMVKSLYKQFMIGAILILCVFFMVSKSQVRGNIHPPTNVSKPASVCPNANKSYDCDGLTFRSSEYVMFPDRTVYVTSIDLKLDECSYVLRGDKVFTCRDGLNVEYETVTIPCGVQLSLFISVFSVFLPVFFSMLTEDVRDMLHVNWLGLVLSLFFFHFLLQTVNMDRVSSDPEFRYTFPSLMHFFTLVMLSWMTIIAHDGMMASEMRAGRRNRSYVELTRNFRGHVLSNINCILLLVTITLLIELLGIIPSNFKPRSGDFCWLTQKTLPLFFTGPVVAFNLINLLNFISMCIYFTKRRNRLGGPLLVLKKNYLIHFKLFIMVDITWLLGVLVFLTEMESLWRVFVCIFILEEAFFVVVPFNKHFEKWVVHKLSGW